MADGWIERVAKPPGTPNPYLGVRFDADGRFLPEAGNTIVAQVQPGSATEAALIWLRDALMALPHASHFAFTEVGSYHMTVFEGVIESRRTPEDWPRHVPLGVDIATATLAMCDMLRPMARLPDFAMRPVEVTPFGLRLTGATLADEKAARQWRDVLAATLGYRRAGHELYGFHTTLAYVRAWLPPEALPDYTAAMRDLTRDFLARVRTMELARPAFCRFADMNDFPPVLPL